MKVRGGRGGVSELSYTSTPSCAPSQTLEVKCAVTMLPSWGGRRRFEVNANVASSTSSNVPTWAPHGCTADRASSSSGASASTHAAPRASSSSKASQESSLKVLGCRCLSAPSTAQPLMQQHAPCTPPECTKRRAVRCPPPRKRRVWGPLNQAMQRLRMLQEKCASRKQRSQWALRAWRALASTRRSAGSRARSHPRGASAPLDSLTIST